MPNPVIDFPWDKEMIDGTGIAHTGPCVLHAITLNACTVLGMVNVYDGTDNTGTLIAQYTLLGASISYQGITFLYDCEMKVGIYIAFANAFAGNLTVTFH